jgi:hypothetical protein
MMEYTDSLNLNAPTAEDPNRSNAVVNDKEPNTPVLSLEKFGFPITCHKTNARTRKKKTKHLQCAAIANDREANTPVLSLEKFGFPITCHLQWMASTVLTEHIPS